MIKLNKSHHELFSSALKVTFVRVIGIVLQAALILYLARVFSLENMGYFALVYAVLSLVRMQGPLGLDQVSLRDISNALNDGQIEKAQSISTASLVFVLMANTCFSLMGFAALLLARQKLQLSLVECALISTAVLSFALNGTLMGQVRGFGKPLLAQIPDSIGLQLFFGLGLLTAQQFEPLPLSSTLLALTLASWAVTILYFIARRRTGIYASTFPAWQELWSLARKGGRISQALILTHLSARAPIFLSAIVLGPASTAILEIATRFGTLTTVVTTSIAATFSPRFAILAKQGAADDLRKTAYLAATLSLIPSLLILVGFALVLPHLFGLILPPAYGDALVPLLIIAGASALNGALGPASNTLIMAGEPEPVRLLSFFRLIAIVTFSILLAAPFGVVGIAWAILLATLLRDGGLTIIAHQKLGNLAQN